MGHLFTIPNMEAPIVLCASVRPIVRVCPGVQERAKK